jgi:ribonucleases P/MRP protein subunit RPP40
MIANYFTDRHQSVKYEKKMSPLMAFLLGVPKGSVLGPLFFLLMINDLAYIIELMCKLFADDTTLGDVDKDLNILINRFVSKLKTLLDWCQFNKLAINWSKTFFMFVTNKRVKLPNEITVDTKLVNDKNEDIKVSVVNSFKLLGVTIDNKLNFTEHCSNLKKIVNKKLNSIKRLFFLCTSVKIHFF